MTAEVIHGDALDVLRAMPDASVDAIVTDPPYCSGGFTEQGKRGARGQGLRSGTLREIGWFVGDNMGAAGITYLLRSIAVEASRIVKRSGSILMFCDWRMVPVLAPAIESAGLRYQNLIAWDKGQAGLGSGFRCQHEMVLHFTNGAPEYHDFSTGNVIATARVNRDEREHQTQKPVELMRRLVRVVSPVGGVVLDPFAGSGTTLVAALMETRDAIGIERSAEYVEIARQRCANVEQGKPPSARPVAQEVLALAGAR